MMDGWTLKGGERQSIVFVNRLQADHYGGYAYVATALEADVILTPAMIGDFHADLEGYQEVGHA